MEPQDPSPPDRWVATFANGDVITVSGDEVRLDASPDSKLPERLESVFFAGWPSLAGWDIDRSPGFDPQWNYLRLVALGATSVTGPFPQQAQLDATPEPGVIVG